MAYILEDNTSDLIESIYNKKEFYQYKIDNKIKDKNNDYNKLSKLVILVNNLF